MNQEKITSFITELRKEKGLTQQEFADILGVSNSAVSKWETGKYLPDPTLYNKIANYFNISLSELLSGQREKKNYNYKTILLIMIIIFLLIINTITLSKFYQEKNDNQTTYKISALNDDLIFNGFLIHSKKNSYLIINNLTLFNPSENIENLKIYIKTNEDTILKIEKEQSSTDLSNSFNNNIVRIDNLNLSDLRLEISYFDGILRHQDSIKIQNIIIDNI